jgi:hypothetical protein
MLAMLYRLHGRYSFQPGFVVINTELSSAYKLSLLDGYYDKYDDQYQMEKPIASNAKTEKRFWSSA